MTSSLSAIQAPPKRTRMRRRNGSAYKSLLGSGSGTRNRPIAPGDSGPCCHESPMAHLLIKSVSEIENDIRVWLRAAHQNISGTRPLERFGLICYRSAYQTRHARVAH